MIQDFMIEQMGKIAWSMNRAGCQISNLEGFVAGLRGLPDEKRAIYLEAIEERAIYSEWAVSESDLFWVSRSPPLIQLPYEAQKHLTGIRVSLFQPYLYLAASIANVSEWMEHYQTGSSLIALIAKRTGMVQEEAKLNIYRYLFGERKTPQADRIETAFPWLQQLIEQFELSSKDLDDIRTPHGTKLPDSLFQRSTFGRYLTQIVKDIVRMGVIHLYLEHEDVPSLILPDAVISKHPEAVIDTWAKNYGLMTVRQ